MTPEEQIVTSEEHKQQETKLKLEEAKKQLEYFEKECGECLVEAVGLEAVYATLETVVEIVGEDVLQETPVLGFILTGLDMVGKIVLMNEVSNPYCQNEINYWKSKVKDVDVDYKDRAVRVEISQKYLISIRQEIRDKLIEKEIEFKKARDNRKSKESEYRNLYNMVYGPHVWTCEERFPYSEFENLRLRNKQKVIELLEIGFKLNSFTMENKAIFIKMCQYLLEFEPITDEVILKEKKTLGNITKALKITNNEVFEVFKELSFQKVLSIPPLNTSMENRSWTIDFEKLRYHIKTA